MDVSALYVEPPKMSEEAKRIRRMVDYLGGPDGGFTYREYAERYGLKNYDAPPDFTKGDIRRALNDYADLLEEQEQQGIERDLLE